jgi:malonyl-CoA/methylmalonyl-CoA synthetase
MTAIDEPSAAAWQRHLAGPALDLGDLRDLLAAGSLHDAFHATARAHPDRLALTIDGVTRTHGDLDAAAARMSSLLRARGVRPGDSVLLCAPSSLELVEAYLGALRAQATVVLSNPAYTAAELQHVALDSHAVAALTAGPARAAVSALAGDLPGLNIVLDLDEVEAGGYDPLEPDGTTEPALLAYTSGTTGKPKAVPLTHANVLSSIRAAMLAWRWSESDVLVHALPLFHQHGLSGIHATLLAGSRAVVHSKFDADRLCEAIRDEHASVLFAVPAIYERLVASDASGALGSLRVAVSGSAALSPALAERIRALAGELPLERYGTTESGLDLSNLYDGPRRSGSVGLPLPGVEVRIVDERGAPVADGDDGEIVLRGPQVFAGYRGDDEATRTSFFGGGWFRTGDIGCRDAEDGFVSITGRAKEVIITGGLNVYPREVELALEASDAVARAAVVGVPSTHWGEEVVAAVVPASGARVDSDELLELASQRLAPYKRPKRIVVVDELPLNPMGKLVRAEVTRLVAG